MSVKKVGVVGATGNQGGAFVKWFSRIPDVATISALCDTRCEKLEPRAAGDRGRAGIGL